MTPPQIARGDAAAGMVGSARTGVLGRRTGCQVPSTLDGCNTHRRREPHGVERAVARVGAHGARLIGGQTWLVTLEGAGSHESP